ncbi:unnamed protein product, partial [Clonostachys solani]
MLKTNGQSEALPMPWISNPKGIEEPQYPFTNVTSLCPSLHNITRIQQLLGSKHNYATESKCEVFEIYHDGKSCPVGIWTRLGPCEVSAHFEKLSTPPENLKMRAISFCDLKTVPSAAFGFRLNMTRQDTLVMLNALQVCPQFCPSLFGEPDYWAPVVIRSRERSGKVYRAEALTTYIITSADDDPWVSRAKSRLAEYYLRTGPETSLQGAESLDPFLLQSILCHEQLIEAKTLISELRGKLSMVSKAVTVYSQSPTDGSLLNAITQKLYALSEEADALYRSIEVGSEVATHCVSARQELLEAQPSRVFAASNVGDALNYLVDSLDSQKQYIQGYKNSKDTAMSLVFHLLTQQDSLTSTEISRDMKNDSASMKTIAVLTMVFLPATAVSSFFGMAFFNLSETGQFVASREIWMFAVTSVPLTALILSLWFSSGEMAIVHDHFERLKL